MSAVARKLGIGRSTLYRKLKDYDLESQDLEPQVLEPACEDGGRLAARA
jgi:transposase-like protein